VAGLIESCGTDKVITVDLHAGQIAGFFSANTSCESVDSYIVGMKELMIHCPELFRNKETVCVVSPDAGGVNRAKNFKS